ncbi:MAG: nucleotidyltransferase [Bacteroidetes bacterium]|nr:nucleotidyltransferase [Bacteroidota bacterium]
MEYVKLFNALAQYQVRYLICGGLAVNVYGIPRMTPDIDILLDFEGGNLANFEDAIKTLFYENDFPVSLKKFSDADYRKKMIQEKNLIAYSFFNSVSGFVTLDVLLDTPIEFEKLWNNKTVKNAGGVSMNIVNIKDLIALKKYANRIQDQNDVLLLSKMIE